MRWRSTRCGRRLRCSRISVVRCEVGRGHGRAAHPTEAIDTGRRLAAKLLCTFLHCTHPEATPEAIVQLCTAAAGLERATHRASPGLALWPHTEPTWSIESSKPAYRNHETGLPGRCSEPYIYILKPKESLYALLIQLVHDVPCAWRPDAPKYWFLK